MESTKKRKSPIEICASFLLLPHLKSARILPRGNLSLFLSFFISLSSHIPSRWIFFFFSTVNRLGLSDRKVANIPATTRTSCFWGVITYLRTYDREFLYGRKVGRWKMPLLFNKGMYMRRRLNGWVTVLIRLILNEILAPAPRSVSLLEHRANSDTDLLYLLLTITYFQLPMHFDSFG